MSTLKIASIRKKGRSYEIFGLKEVPDRMPLPFPVQQSALCSAMPAKETLIRSFDTPLEKERDIFAALDFQAEAHIPYPTEQAALQAQITHKQKRQTKLTLAAMRKDHLQHHLDALHTHDIEPDKITSAHFALAALSTILPNRASMNLYVHIGEKVVTCSLVENGKLLMGYVFDAHLELKHEIQKTVLALTAALKTGAFESIFLFGNATQETLSLIADVTQKSVHFPFSPLLSLSQTDLMHYALAIGAAIAGSEKGFPNFREKEFAHPRPFKRLRKPLLIYATSVALLTLSLFAVSKLALSDQQKAVAHHFQSLNIESGPLHTPFDYHRALAAAEKEIAEQPNTFPLHAVVPKVHEVLGWINTSPLSMEMDAFHYTMIKRPSFSQRQEHYQVKVFLEFSATASEARLFHEMLLDTNQFVDNKQEVQWTMNREGKYRASFYLKDRTRYL